jgi:hypothetical protein
MIYLRSNLVLKESGLRLLLTVKSKEIKSVEIMKLFLKSLKNSLTWHSQPCFSLKENAKSRQINEDI